MTHSGEAQVNIDQTRTSPTEAGLARVMRAYQDELLGWRSCCSFLPYTRGSGNPFAVLGLAIVAALAERGRVGLASSTEVSISVLPTVFAAAVFGPLAAMIVAASSFAGDFPLESLKRGQI